MHRPRPLEAISSWGHGSSSGERKDWTGDVLLLPCKVACSFPEFPGQEGQKSPENLCSLYTHRVRSGPAPPWPHPRPKVADVARSLHSLSPRFRVVKSAHVGRERAEHAGQSLLSPPPYSGSVSRDLRVNIPRMETRGVLAAEPPFSWVRRPRA